MSSPMQWPEKITLKLDQIAHCLDCRAQPAIIVSGVSIDSRDMEPGFLFVALRGERFDGHEFIPLAIEKGAVAVVCEQPNTNYPHIPQLIVSDALIALAKLAKFHRQTINCPIIALTGSNGKTTVKEMIAAILPKPSLATSGNLNNHIGAPLSVLRLVPEHRYAVFELGANHLGEIAYTVDIVQPDVSLINNIAPAHIEGFGSIEGVANAKGEIYQGLKSNGIAVINQDDKFAHFWDPLLKGKQVIRFSLNKPADIYTKECVASEDGSSFILVTPKGEALVSLKIPGMHSIQNALAAAACCYAIGISLQNIIQGLTAFTGVPGRMTFLNGKNHSVVIDDTYNANLRSVLTAVDVLANHKGRRILVLGDLGELGKWTREHHEEIGLTAKNKGIDTLLTCGKHSEFSSLAFGENAKHYQTKEQLVDDLLLTLNKDTIILVKGSRAAAMEKIVHQLMSETA